MFAFLVVDDDKDAADSLADALRLHGHDCTVAYDGRSALDESKRFRTDAVILDIDMPGLDGYETARAIRMAPTEPPPVLVALTGLSSRAARGEAMRAGFDAFLVKPANPVALLHLVERLARERAEARRRPFEAGSTDERP